MESLGVELMQQDLAIVEVVIVPLQQQDLTEIIVLVFLEVEVLQDLVEMPDQEERVLKDQQDQQVDYLHVQQRDLVHQDLDLLSVDHRHLQEVVDFLEEEVLQDLQADQEEEVLVAEEEEDSLKFFHLFY